MDATVIDRLVIRKASETDVPLLLCLIRELADYEHLSHECVATEESIKDILFGNGINAEALVAEYDGTPVGFALFFHNFSTFLGKRGIYIEDIFVKPDFRRKGIGRALLTHIVRLAKERNCGRVEWCVLDWNEPAIKFYRGIGAKPLDEWTVFRLSGDALQKFGGETL
jgi:GNAT superfamily N-acetyltransferase